MARQRHVQVENYRQLRLAAVVEHGERAGVIQHDPHLELAAAAHAEMIHRPLQARQRIGPARVGREEGDEAVGIA